MTRFLAGAVLGALLAIAAPLAWLASGGADVAATAGPGRLEAWLAPRVRDASVAAQAPAAPNPRADAWRQALPHYRENCLLCHGAPGVEVGEIARGLSPAPPLLDSPAIQEHSDGELFWVVRNGLRMTGMPAFAPTHTDEELWEIVALLRHLGDLSPADLALLREAAADEAHHHEAVEEPAAPHVHGTGESHEPHGP